MHSVGDEVSDVGFAIEGLQFETNLVQEVKAPRGWFTQKLSSSPGPLISDFVTHEPGFSYSTYGIHIGQDDRLTFLGDTAKRIQGHFVDCRNGSSTLHKSASIEFAPSVYRRLVIPRGVAHTFDNIEYVVTRDEPIWYSADDNRDWNVDNDLVSVRRSTDPRDFPIVRVNGYCLPEQAHQFVSRLSQALLETPKAYLARFQLTIGSEDKYVMFEPTSWADDDLELKALLDVDTVPGVEVRRSRYALTGPHSWTLVPNTGACVTDVLSLPASLNSNAAMVFHARTRKWYTFLTRAGLDVQLDVVDCRRDSATLGVENHMLIRCDPRISIAIDHGIAYSFRTNEDIFVRCEHEVFADEDEPRDDLPPFGQDMTVLSRMHLDLGLRLPTLRCPDAIVYRMAQHEVAALMSPS